MSMHPDVFLPKEKEIHYFSLHANKKTNWYADHFKAAQRNQITGEITPYYLFHPQAPIRIRGMLPTVKLLILLRDPVERALSQYFHARRMGFEKLELEHALEMEKIRLAGAEKWLEVPGNRHFHHQKSSYLARSRYEEQIRRYEKLFKPEQILILRSEDLFKSKNKIWEKLCDFLEIEKVPTPSVLPKANTGNMWKGKVKPETRSWMRDQLKNTYERISRRYDITWE